MRAVRRGPRPGAGGHRRQLLRPGRALAAGRPAGLPRPRDPRPGVGPAHAVRGTDRGRSHRASAHGRSRGRVGRGASAACDRDRHAAVLRPPRRRDQLVLQRAAEPSRSAAPGLRHPGARPGPARAPADVLRGDGGRLRRPDPEDPARGPVPAARLVRGRADRPRARLRAAVARRTDRTAGDPRRLPGEGRDVRGGTGAHRAGRARRCARRRPGRAGRPGDHLRRGRRGPDPAGQRAGRPERATDRSDRRDHDQQRQAGGRLRPRRLRRGPAALQLHDRPGRGQRRARNLAPVRRGPDRIPRDHHPARPDDPSRLAGPDRADPGRQDHRGHRRHL